MSASREKRKRKATGSELKANNAASAKKAAKKNKLRNVIIEVVAVLVVLVFVVLLVFNSGLIHKNVAGAAVGDHKVKVTELNYYYNNTINTAVSNMGDYASSLGLNVNADLHDQPCYFDETISWADYFYESAMDNLHQDIVLADKAAEEGMTLTEESVEAVEATIEAIKNYAATNSMTFQQYLRTMYGKGITAKQHRTMLERTALASQYRTQLYDAMEYTVDEMEAYYANNSAEFDRYNYRSYFINGFDTSSEIEKEEQLAISLEKAEDMVAKLEAVSDPAEREQLYIELTPNYVDEKFVSNYENDPDFTLTRNMNEASMEEYLREFILADERQYGDVTIIDGTTGYYVVMFVNYGRDNDVKSTFRQIYFSPNTELTSNWSDDEWASAKDSAQTLYDLILETEDFTAEKFAEYASVYSNDTATSQSGGLYEDVLPSSVDTHVGSLIKAGELEEGGVYMVKGSDGYYIIYFEGYGMVAWEESAESYMKDRDYETWFLDESVDYPFEVKKIGETLCEY